MLTDRKQRFQLILFAILLILALAVSLRFGSTALSWHDMLSNSHPLAHRIFMSLRLPRSMSALTCGGLLALAGALLQALLRNPLADPALLGISGGAACLHLLGLLFGVSVALQPLLAFIGALTTILIVFGLSYQGKKFAAYRVLLSGVMIATLWGALTSMLINVSDNATLRQAIYWLMGSLSDATFPLLALIVLLLGLISSAKIASPLNIMLLGDIKARTLGVNTKKMAYGLYFLSALLTSAAVITTGPIGFVGLVVPQTLRLIGMRDYRFLLPSSALLGATFLLCADTIARTAFTPTEMPVGIITALIGAPIFLALLVRAKNP